MINNVYHLSPDALWCIASMGHGDRIAIVDANFPSFTMAKNNHHIVLQGEKVIDVVKEIMSLIPLDHAVEKPIELMQPKPELSTYQNSLIEKLEIKTKYIHQPRHDFYERAESCFAILSTSTKEPFMNVIISKGTFK